MILANVENVELDCFHTINQNTVGEIMKQILFVLASTAFACRDSLEGTWTGDLECNGRDYSVEAQMVETKRFDYDGQMIFAYDELVTVNNASAIFSAQLQYDFTTSQTAIAGGQDIYLDMMWTKLYCEVEYANGTVEEGGCKNIGGIDDSDKGRSIGYVQWRYSGTDKLSIDDSNCSGALYLY